MRGNLELIPNTASAFLYNTDKISLIFSPCLFSSKVFDVQNSSIIEFVRSSVPWPGTTNKHSLQSNKKLLDTEGDLHNGRMRIMLIMM